MSDSDKRFDPTPHRREQFRKEGRFARARDATGLAATAAVLGVLLGTRASILEAITTLFRATVGHLTGFSPDHAGDVLRQGGITLTAVVGPVILAAAVGAIIAGLAQAGVQLNLGLVAIKAERLDPVARLQQLLSPKRAGIEIVLSLLRIGVVGLVAYEAATARISELLGLARLPAESSAERIGDAVLHVVLAAGGALGAIALVDYVQSRLTLEQQMKMSRHELMEEMRQQEGDPKLKARMKARVRALAKKRALQNVKKAHVVVTNPTHVAVALKYDPEDAAPVVVAKGLDDEALRIRTEARKYGIPILENRPLARALEAEVPVGQTIPAAHFAAVARVLAFVYRLPGRRRRGTRRA